MAEQRRSRKRRDPSRPLRAGIPEGGAPAEPLAFGEDDERPLTRAEQRAARDEEIRASLEPLAPGERPGAVTAGAIVAVVIALVNVIAYLGGARVNDQESSVPALLLFELIMLVAAWGLWRARYWAVLGFQVLLGVTLVVAGLSLTVASSILGALLSLAVLVPGGYLFWKLIRAMARIQMPARPQPRRPS